MRIKHMFKKTVRDIRGEEQENTPEVPDNLMRKCNACKAAVFVDEVKQNQALSFHEAPEAFLRSLCTEGDSVLPCEHPTPQSSFYLRSV